MSKTPNAFSTISSYRGRRSSPPIMITRHHKSRHLLKDLFAAVRSRFMKTFSSSTARLAGLTAILFVALPTTLHAAYASTDKLRIETRLCWVTGFELNNKLLDNALVRLDHHGLMWSPHANSGPIRLELQLKDKHLYLLSLWLKIGNLHDPEGYQKIPITNSVGTKIEDPIFASWFTGELKLTHWSLLPECLFSRKGELFHFKNGIHVKNASVPVSYKDPFKNAIKRHQRKVRMIERQTTKP